MSGDASGVSFALYLLEGEKKNFQGSPLSFFFLKQLL